MLLNKSFLDDIASFGTVAEGIQAAIHYGPSSERKRPYSDVLDSSHSDMDRLDGHINDIDGRGAMVLGNRKHRRIHGVMVPADLSAVISDNSRSRNDAKSAAPFPQRGNVHVAHLDADMCDILVNCSRVYDNSQPVGVAEAANVRVVHSGDTVGELSICYSSVVSPHVITPATITIVTACGLIFGERFMVLIPCASTDNVIADELELSLGGLRLRSVVGFSHFGISIPSRYFSKLVFHTRGTRRFTCMFQTGNINKGFGHFQTRFGSIPRLPSLRFSHALGQGVNINNTPQGVALYAVEWVGATQSILRFSDARFFHVGHVTVLLDKSVTFIVLAPTPTAYKTSVVALLAGASLSPISGESLVDCVSRARINDGCEANEERERHVISELNNFGCPRTSSDILVTTYTAELVRYYAVPFSKFDRRSYFHYGAEYRSAKRVGGTTL